MGRKKGGELETEARCEIDAAKFRLCLMRWYRANARDLPWRGTDDPYRIWVSEIMLQQTRVAAAIGHYNEFLRRFPTVVALALASEEEVLAAWSGLGYYHRARMLHRTAQFLVEGRKGVLPSSSAELLMLRGIGEYTAAAIASIAFGESVAVVDGNVERVILRLTGRDGEATAAARRFVRAQAQRLMPRRRLLTSPKKTQTSGNVAGDHNQAMMELGATVCLPRAPLCDACPVRNLCRTQGEHETPARAPQRSLPVAYLLDLRKRGPATEVLLERRAKDATVMPAMFELPTLSLDVVEGMEPALRVRHSIMSTNYYVSVYALRSLAGESEAAVGKKARSAVQTVRKDARELKWARTTSLAGLPLTGLARKILQRLHIMDEPRVELAD